MKERRGVVSGEVLVRAPRTPLLVGLFLVIAGLCILMLYTFLDASPVTKPVEVTREAVATVAGSLDAVSVLTKLPVGADEVRVTRVIDGDTIELVGGIKVRYIGVDTPETVHPDKPVECFGAEAKEENRRLVMGKTVRLEKDTSETDRYGRLLRYVYVDPPAGEAGDVMVNEVLVQNGFAQVVTYPPDVLYQQRLLAAQRLAREERKGLWGGCPSNQTNVTSQTNNGCTIKGNISSNGEKIYHASGCSYYEKTVIDETRGERWFCSEDEAVAAGWRKAKNCP